MGLLQLFELHFQSLGKSRNEPVERIPVEDLEFEMKECHRVSGLVPL